MSDFLIESFVDIVIPFDGQYDDWCNKKVKWLCHQIVLGLQGWLREFEFLDSMFILEYQKKEYPTPDQSFWAGREKTNKDIWNIVNLTKLY